MGSWFQKFWEKRLAKEQTATARVISRRTECACLVTFHLNSGEELELCVTGDQYHDLREGTVWDLRWKGTELLTYIAKE